MFLHTIIPEEIGLWRFQALYPGNSYFFKTKSNLIELEIEKAKLFTGPIELTPILASIIAAIGAIIAAIVGVIYRNILERRKEKRKNSDDKTEKGTVRQKKLTEDTSSQEQNERYHNDVG